MTKKRDESSMTEQQKEARNKQLAEARRRKKNTLELVVRYVLNRADIEYDFQVTLEWAPGKTIRVDVFVEPNIVIEVDGDAWHGYPGSYGPDDPLPNGMTAREKWAKDAEIRAGLEKNGYKVMAVWENDLRKQTADALKRVLDACGREVPDIPGRYKQLAAEAKRLLAKLERELKNKHYRKHADEINERARIRRETDPEWRDSQNEKARKRLRDNPELRARQNQAQNDKYHNDPVFRAKTKAQANERYRTEAGVADSAKARSRKRYRDNKDEINAQGKARYEKNREKILAGERAKYANDQEYAERKRANSREYGRKNPDKVMGKKREYYKRNRDEISVKRKKKKIADTDKIIEILGGACSVCGARATVARRAADECEKGAHKERRWYSGYYATRPAEARRFLRPFCAACAKAEITKAARKAHSGKRASKETRAKMSQSAKRGWKSRRDSSGKAPARAP